MCKIPNIRLFSGIVLALATSVANGHRQTPIPVEKRYSDQGVIDCIRKNTKELDSKLAEIKRKETASKKSLTSIAPLVLERRRTEEEWCSVEARCLADAVPRHREHYYGLTLSTCLEN